MAYREVTMTDITEVLRQWLAGAKCKQIARRLSLDPKTVRRYTRTAAECGLSPGVGAVALTEDRVADVLTALDTMPGRPRGETWSQCEAHREFIAGHLSNGVRLSKIRRLLARRGVVLAQPTLYRFATTELGFGRQSPTIPVADGTPGEEVSLDTGWMRIVLCDERGRRRRMRAWIFTPSVSRHRFVYPCLGETTTAAIEACEAAWRFYSGVFRVVIPDNTKAIISTADPLQPRLVEAFLEYAQARGFVVDPARVRAPKDKARVERSVPYVRDDCFGGERITTLEQARERAVRWARDEAGMRRHSRTLRLPREHFEAVEQTALLPVPTARYDIPLWSDPKVARDQHAQVARALYSLPTRYVGKTLHARADRTTVRFYDGTALVKTHPRQTPGGRSTDREDFPAERAAYAFRDVVFLEREATRHGEAIGRFAHALLAVPLPWTRMRRVYALLGLVRRFGAERVEEACRDALAVDLIDVTRLKRILALAVTPPPQPSIAVVPASARYLRPYDEYRMQQPSLALGIEQGGDR
jgi:hypothetical protein